MACLVCKKDGSRHRNKKPMGEKCGRVYSAIMFALFGVTFMSAFIYTMPRAGAEEASVSTATVTVGESCSVVGTTDTSHTVDLINGTYSGANHPTGIGQTTIKAYCNDNSGFAIYAIGYTNNEDGNTTLHSDVLGDAHDINTGLYTAGSTTDSTWSMKLTGISGTYAPTISNGTNGTENFTTWHVIPEEYTKVAYRTSATDVGDLGIGSSLTTTYDAYISATQLAGTYMGQVKYTLVHPNKADDSNKPIAPMAPSDCPPNSICYAPNASDVEGSMISEVSGSTLSEISSKYPTAAKQTYACSASGSCSDISSSTTSITLIAPNYKRAGFGFAGWSTDFTATDSSTIYGPNETITITAGSLSPNGMILYPVWVAKDTTNTMQTFSSSRCNSMPQATYSNGTITVPSGSIIALEDERDGNVYTVARLVDGNCWMTENLRLADTHTENGNTIDTTLTATNTNTPLFNKLSATSDTWCITNDSACFDQTMLNTNNTNLGGENASGADLISTPGYPINSNAYGQNGSTFSWYSYGNYYNWYSATAGNGTYSKSSGDANGDLCPTGWHLPYGNSSNTGNTSGGFYYLNQLMGKNTSIQGSREWRMFPNNFIYSGFWSGSSADFRGNGGRYWSSSAGSNNGAYLLSLNSSGVLPGTVGGNKYSGFSVRCVAGGLGS